MAYREFAPLSGTRRLQACGGLVWLVLLLAGTVCAQINTGRIDGTVHDTSGAVVPESRITVTNDATGTVSTAQASAGGDYIVNFLVPGTYCCQSSENVVF